MPDADKKNRVGAVVIAVIVLGAIYVAYSMYVQFDEHSNNQFDSARRGYQSSGEVTAGNALEAHDHPFKTALLATDALSVQLGQGELLIQNLQQKIGQLNIGMLLSPTLFPSPEGSNLLQEIVAADKAAGINAAASAETKAGLAKVKQALAFSKSHPELPRTFEMNILLLAVKLAYKAKDLDLARTYLHDAIVLARQFQDYKMDTYTAFDCLLSGNVDVAARYEQLIAQYNAELKGGHYDKLPALAAGLADVTKDLPKDNFYALTAKLAGASSLYLADKKGPQAQTALKTLSADAAACGDIRVQETADELWSYFGAPLNPNPHRYKQL